jgi:hypothetical protein
MRFSLIISALFAVSTSAPTYSTKRSCSGGARKLLDLIEFQKASLIEYKNAVTSSP